MLVAVQLSLPGLYRPPVLRIAAAALSAPDDHFTASPHRCVSVRPSGALVVLVAAQVSVLGLSLPPEFKKLVLTTAPDNHFSAGPDCRVKSSSRRRVGDGGRRPRIGRRVVFAAGIQIASDVIITAPNDHFTAGPDRSVVCSCVGRVVRGL